MFENVDGRTTDGRRTTDAGVTGILIAHLGAFGSGELTRSEVKVKVTVTRKWYATLRHPKMYPHTQFGIPTSKNKGDMHRTRSRTDTRTDGWTDGRTVRFYMPSKVPLGA